MDGIRAGIVAAIGLGARLVAWVAVAGLLSGCLAVPSSGGPPVVSPTSAATAPASSVVLSSASPAVHEPFATWTRIDLGDPPPHVYGGSTVRVAVDLGGSLLAIGAVNGGCCDGGFSTDTRLRVWRSTDGLTWTLEPDRREFGLGWPLDGAVNRDRVVVVGHRRLDGIDGQVRRAPAVWRSADGETWERIDAVPALEQVTATSAGFVAATNTEHGPQIWRSPDGRTWRLVASSDTLGAGRIADLDVTASGVLVAVGSAADPATSPDPVGAAAWRSTDGTTWRRAPVQSGMGDASMTRVTVNSEMLVAIGNGLTTGAVWTSPDGLAWTRHTAAPFEVPGTSLEAVFAREQGLLVLGSVEASGGSTSAHWVSGDGVTWSSAEADGHRIEAAIAHDADLIGFDGWWDADVGRPIPVVWVIR